MLITKTEPDAGLMKRQVKYFEITKALRLHVMSPTEYVYDYVPGGQCTDVEAAWEYLNYAAHMNEPMWDTDTGVYHEYIRGLCVENDIDIPTDVIKDIVGLDLQEPQCMVHGDATMENFLQTDRGVVGIDPGHPRGFSHKENDVGKILQSILTHWELVRHGSRLDWLNEDKLPITRWSLVSLLTHWIRIVKNRARHPGHVEIYARNIVIPSLCRELRDSRNFSDVTYTWESGRCAKLWAHFLHEASDIAKGIVPAQ